MKVFLIKRITAFTITIIVASVVVFLVLEVLPGDPASVMLGMNAAPETLSSLRAELGLDRSLPIRYGSWVGGMITGDFGVSYTYDVPVLELIAERIVISLPLAVISIILSTAFAIPLGILAAAYRGRSLDFTIMSFSQLGVAIPNFWFAMLLIIFFSITLRWVPSGGFVGWNEGFFPAVRSLFLPAIALALPQSAILTRITRSALLDVLNEDFVRTARARGVSHWRSIWKHALRNALIPVITIMGLQFSYLLAGTIIIENVFYLPGIGRLIFQAIAQRDLITVKSLVILLASAVVFINLIVDILYAVIDPRLRRGHHG